MDSIWQFSFYRLSALYAQKRKAEKVKKAQEEEEKKKENEDFW